MVQSTLSLMENSIVNNVSASVYGLASVTAGSILSIANNVTLTQCKSTGPAFYIVNSPNVTISNASFYQFNQSLLSVQHSSVTIQNSMFFNISGSILNAEKA